jgi:purine nucleosidase
MSIALEPSIGTNWGEHYVDVETQSELTRGMTVVDRLNVAGDDRNQAVGAPVLEKKCNASVCWSIDNQRWKEALFSASAVVPESLNRQGQEGARRKP